MYRFYYHVYFESCLLKPAHGNLPWKTCISSIRLITVLMLWQIANTMTIRISMVATYRSLFSRAEDCRTTLVFLLIVLKMITLSSRREKNGRMLRMMENIGATWKKSSLSQRTKSYMIYSSHNKLFFLV